MLVLLTRVDPEEHMDRWYMVTVQPTLFEPLAVICSWGNRQNDYQRVHIIPAASPAQALALAEKIVVAKQRRGYRVVLEHPPTLQD